ncbi:GNAT family N-acetyltransferase [Leucobacter sp. wl10]|uniref:GNAT family N-acetyltransferase n=1 Tax=Leucobacter sp. wl10 TaxID=2304677 RepID=UPI000E5A34F0|nr:GNAT family N-acetyltransferase [Leucobacter sp. wl10]RGE21993.1 GNAT family N-acetyltransferase [Leucobacter sp. wl10]
MSAGAAAGRGEASVRFVAEADRDAWAALYRGYRDFYGKPHDPAVYETVWGWLMDPAHESRCLVAEVDGAVVGIGHFRRFARPIDGGYGLYLDDLFTAPEARGTGAASAILRRLGGIARDEGAALVRWITAESNAAARSLYDRVAAQTAWVTYDLPPSE